MPQSIATNTLVAAAARAVQVALGFVLIAATTRVLGEAAFGTYATLLAYGSLLLIGADLGLYLTFTREAGKAPAQASALLSDISWVRFWALVPVFVLGSLVLRLIPALQQLSLAFWIAAAGLAAQSFSQLLMGVFQARSVIWRASLGDIAGRLVQLATVAGVPALVVWLVLEDVVTAVVLAFTAGTVAATLVHLSLLPVPWRLKAAPSWARIRQILAVSWPAAALLALNAIYFRIDILLLSLFRPEAEVGAYGLAYRIIESALFLPAMFGGLLLPHLSRDAALPKALFQESLHALVLVGSGVCLLIALLSAPLIQFLSGADFLRAAPLLAILTLALFVMFLGNLFGFTLVARGQQRALMWLYGGLVIFNILANLATIPRFGALAAAWVTVATEVLAATVAGILVYRLSPFRLSPVFGIKIILVLAATAIAILFMPLSWHVLLRSVLAGIIFIAAGVVAGIVHPRQFQALVQKP